MIDPDDQNALEKTTVDALRHALCEVSRATERMVQTRSAADLAELDHARAVTALYDLFNRLERKS